MSKAESTSRSGVDGPNVDFMRSLVKQYSELGLWTSALFWADAAGAASKAGTASGDDVWLLASTLLARGEHHRAAYAVTSRGLHRQHLLCLGLAMRAHLATQEASVALSLMEDCDPAMLEPKSNDQTHNRALAGVLVWQARALAALERREAAAEALCAALRADCACVEALALLHRQRALTHKQEMELIDSLPLSSQLGAPEGALLRGALRDRVGRHAPPPPAEPVSTPEMELIDSLPLSSQLGAPEGALLRGALRDRVGRHAPPPPAEPVSTPEMELIDSLPLSSQLGAPEGALLRGALRDRVGRHAPPPPAEPVSTPEMELIDSLPLSSQLGAPEGALLRGALRDRVGRHAPPPPAEPVSTPEMELIDSLPLSSQLGAPEGALLRGALRDRVGRHAPPPPAEPVSTPEMELIDSLPLSSQLGAPEGALLRGALLDRVGRHAPPPPAEPVSTPEMELIDSLPLSSQLGAPEGPPPPAEPVNPAVDAARARMAEAAQCRGRRLAASCDWAGALKALDTVDPWCCAPVRAACLVELRRSAELFAFAHALVDSYPHSWTAWFAVGCYYYLIGKNELARRYLNKAKSLEPGAGCAWLAQGHSFAADNEHDQAMAAYFKASQLMAGSHLPPLYVGVECALLNNFTMCERFLLRAATLHSSVEPIGELSDSVGAGAGAGGGGWSAIARCVLEPHVAHEAGAAAFSAGQPRAAHDLWTKALQHATREGSHLHPRWAATLDALGHACRKLGQPAEALRWHEQALALRPARAPTYAAMGLCLALLGKEREAADALHSALSKDPDDVVSLALLDAIVDRLDTVLSEQEIPQFPFGPILISPPPAPATPDARADRTDHSDMSMSFELSVPGDD